MKCYLCGFETEKKSNFGKYSDIDIENGDVFLFINNKYVEINMEIKKGKSKYNLKKLTTYACPKCGNVFTN